MTLLSFTARSSEPDTLDPDIKTLFPSSDSLLWVRTYCGKADELHPVTVRLGYDGLYCRGYIQYGSVGLRLKWDGLIQQDELRAYEIDSLDNHCGLIQGKIRDSVLLVTWQNTSRTIGSRIALSWCEEQSLRSYDPPSDLWLRYYAGTAGNTPLTVLLQKNASDRIRGVFYFPLKDTSWAATGHSFTADQYLLRPQDLNNRFLADSILIDSLIQKQGRIHWKDTSAVIANGDLKLKATYEMSSYLYMDYFSNFAFVYPRLKAANFNNWFGQLISDWLRDGTEEAAAFSLAHPQPVAELRATVRAYGWSDTELITKRIISGQVNYTCTWSAGEYSRAFNFDLKKGREINIEDIFKPEFNYKLFIDAFIRRNFTRHPLYEDPDFRAWLEQEDFRIFTVRRDGITFSTKFNILYGRVHITIPYTELEPFITKSSAVRTVMQHTYGIVLPEITWPAFLKKKKK